MRDPIQYVLRVAVTLALTVAVAPAVRAADTFAATPVAAQPGTVTALAHWEIQSTSKAPQDGAEVSRDGFATQGWYPVSGRATVMAGLLENGQFKRIFYSDNLRTAGPPAAGHGTFDIPWWYRSEFTLADDARGTHTLLRINGIDASADVWVNGHEVADHAQVAGAYPVHTFDVTRWVHAGINTVALRVHPGTPQQDFLMGWVDWNPTPPDNNMGPWRGVDIVQTGPVELRFPQVTSKVALPGLERAALTVKVQVRNLGRVARDADVTGMVAGVSLQQHIQLAPDQTRTVVFSPQTDPSLELQRPKIWWPADMGAHPLYHLQLSVAVHDTASDHASATFGIRSVTSRLTAQGYRQFVVNGKPVLVRGGGWAPDMFLRSQPKRLAAEFSYIHNLGLNAIRSEGKLEDSHFYDLADRYGIMILPGWECCDKWESAAKTGGAPWDAHDYKIADASMASEARLLRNHPSVIAFLIGSDNAPPPKVAQMYVDTLHAEDWPDPIVSAASDQATSVAGPSGMKMAGPYAWIPPAYWYGDAAGAAFGFDSEVSAGADIPRLGDVQRMLSPLEQLALWKYPKVRQYHATAAWSPFAALDRFDKALAGTYGAPTSLADYVDKAQLANYANTRAQFEAFNARMDAPKPSTGVIYWMLDNAWPSLHWHLFDWYLNPAGAYFGAKEANQPVHIQYSYGSRAIVLVNHTLATEHGLQARIRVRNLQGAVLYDKRRTGIELAGDHALRLLTLPTLRGLPATYFVELELDSAAGKSISRNVYWLSRQTPELDWAKSNWYMTPVTRYADLTALQSLRSATVRVQGRTRRDGSDDVTTVTLALPKSAKGVAFFQHVSIRRGAHGKLALPILWSGNDVTLWPGEAVTLTARYAAADVTAPVVAVSGWNAPDQNVPAAFAAEQP